MRTTRLMLVALLLAMLTLGAGCADLHGAIAQTARWRDEAHTLTGQLGDRLTALHEQRAALPDNHPDAPALDAAISTARAELAALESAAQRVDAVLDEARQPSDGLTRLADHVSAWVPAPAQGPLVLGAALAATLLRSQRLKSSAVSIIESIDHVMTRDERFRSLFADHANTIRTIQTPQARRLVNRTLAKAPG